MLSEQLEQEAFDGGFIVEDTEMVGDLEGMFIDNVILVDNRSSLPYRRNCILRHELEHGYTCPYDLRRVPPELRGKLEATACRNSLRKLAPIDSLIALYSSGLRAPWEFSEALEIDEPSVISALKAYHSIYGYNYVYKGYVINFMPLCIRISINNT